MPRNSEFREISSDYEMASFHLMKISPFKLTLNHMDVNYVSFKQNESCFLTCERKMRTGWPLRSLPALELQHVYGSLAAMLGPKHEMIEVTIPFSRGIFPDPEITAGSPALRADSLLSEPPGKP